MGNVKKNSTKEVVVNEIFTEDIDVEVEKTTKVENVKKQRKKHDPDELIACRSVVFGELLVIGPKTKLVYSWANEGDIREMEYQDLKSLMALRSKTLFAPRIIIEDEDLRNEWSTELDPVYNAVEDINLRTIFSLPQRQFVAQVKQLPAGMKSSMQNMAYSMMQDGSLYDLNKIKALDEILGTELKMMI